jgi:hypothetical protein
LAAGRQRTGHGGDRRPIPGKLIARFDFQPSEPRDAAFDLSGFKNVLALRAEIEGGHVVDRQHYIDLNYCDRAIRIVEE